jgi:ABC-2 type transport system permease protein/lipopolysaccharide transport system permease protein
MKGISMFKEITEAWRYRAVVENFTWTALGVRYRKSFLGYLWTVLSPMLKYAIMGIVFEIVGKFNMPNYYGFMFLGSIYFGFFSTVVSSSTTAFIANEHYIKKIYVPKLVFILNIVMYEIVNFILVLVAILSLLLLMGQVTLSITWLFVPVAIVITIAALVGLSALIAVATVYFRDLQHLVDILFQALFFATPIFYPLEALEKSPLFSLIARMNPVLYFINMFRDPLTKNVWPDPISVSISIVFALLMLILGTWTVNRHSNRIIFKL